GWVHGYVAWFPETIQTVLGWIFRPIAFAMGVPWHDSGTIGSLLGERMVLNEFFAYKDLGPLRGQLDPLSFTIATFALCGFANISSVGIQIGGIGALGPGLAGVAEAVSDAVRIPYKEIPGFPEPGAPGHKGELVGGTLEGVPVLVQSGRFHLYEGHAPDVAALPTRVFARLGATTLVVTNAAGGI